MYSFLTCITRSGNAILQSIMNSDVLYTSPLCRHWRKMLYVYIVISHTLVFYMDVMFGNKVIELKTYFLHHCIVLSSWLLKFANVQ